MNWHCKNKKLSNMSNKLLCRWAKCRHLQQQMQQITQLISFLAKSSYMRVYMCVYIMFWKHSCIIREYLCWKWTFSQLSRRKRLLHVVRLPILLLYNRLRNILPETAPLVVVLVAPLSSMAAVSKALPPSARKSHRSDAEVSECRLSHTLRFDKCLYCREA